MKKYILFITVALLSLSCNGQSIKAKKENTNEKRESMAEKPNGSWKVDKEFDENGNLINVNWPEKPQ